jgi:hypothetical protein
VNAYLGIESNYYLSRFVSLGVSGSEKGSSTNLFEGYLVLYHLVPEDARDKQSQFK